MVTPHRIAPDTVLIPRFLQVDGGFSAVHSMVITGREPVLVDTGAALHSDAWREDVFSVVDPEDVRWIFISHDDADHIGNLPAALELCANAVVVTAPRVGAAAMPVRPIAQGEAFHAGDRVLTAVRPPFYDAPTTFGLYDDRSGVYWAADCFGAVTPSPTAVADDLPLDEHLDAVHRHSAALSPWHVWLDPVRHGRYIDHLAAMEITAITSAHGPTVTGTRIPRVFDVLRDLCEHPQ